MDRDDTLEEAKMLLTRVRRIQPRILYNLVSARPFADDKKKGPQKPAIMPVPKLEDTLKTYLDSVQPFYGSDAEQQETKQAVEQFASCDGKRLQELLLKKAPKYVNWLTYYWVDVAYLEYRDSVIVNSSPGLVFPRQCFKSPDDFISYATKLTMAALTYKQDIDMEKIPKEFMGKDPLDMTQYEKIFGTCRIPGEKRDHLEFNPQSKHIVVASNNHFWKLKVLGNDSKLIDECQLRSHLAYIYDNSKRDTIPVGLLSGENRDNWGIAYQDLTENVTNNKSVREIQTSLFLLCFDKDVEKTDEETDKNYGAKMTLFGHGPDGNCGNRWFDKTVQFMVTPAGYNGLTYEHSPSEGQPIAIMTDYILNWIKKGSNECASADERLKDNPRKLEFCIDANLTSKIQKARCAIKKLTDLQLDCFQFTGFGKNFCKKQKLSPDSFIQVAIQSAYVRLHNKPAGHYESASLRKFQRGRTETIRSCLQPIVNFAKLSMSEEKSLEEKEKALRAAVNAHKNYTNLALQGKGVDRHLLALKLLAMEKNLPIPAFYKDKAYQRSTYMRISTSQVATKADGFMCYGPIVQNGYACCYNPRDNDINFALSCWCSSETDLPGFKKSLEDILNLMKCILESKQGGDAGGKKSKL